MNSGPKTPLSLMIAIFTLALTLDMTLIAATSRRPKLESARQGCEYEGALYMPGSKFKPDPCTSCRCKKRGGVVNCIAKDCTPDPNCRKYVVFGSKKCCPSCLEMGCRHSDGKVYKQGEVIRNEPCVRCYCPLGGGEPVCDVTACPLSECVDPKEVPGLCCPICPNGPNCQIGLLTLPINQSVVIEGATCACERFVDTDGHTRVSARCNKDIDQTDEREHTDLPL